MYCIKSSLLEAQATKLFLIRNGFLDHNHIALRTAKFIYFPVKEECIEQLKKLKEPKLVVSEKKLEKVERESIKGFLQNKLTEKEIEQLPSSFDIIGSTIIIEIPESLVKKEKDIAEALLKKHKNIKTILKKADIFSGEFRTRKLKFLAGENTKETIHRESNVMIKLNLENVYFSSRLSSERKRVSEQVKNGEEILVMFSGCAPYPLVLAKNTGCKIVYGVEKNPAAHKYAEENIKLNKLGNIKLFEGDVREIVPGLKKTFDRILMPLPKSAEDFLDIAFVAAKKGTIIHFYDFQKEKDFPEASIAKIDSVCRKHNIKYKVLNIVKCGQYAPYEFRVCVDFKVL